MIALTEVNIPAANRACGALRRLDFEGAQRAIGEMTPREFISLRHLRPELSELFYSCVWSISVTWGFETDWAYYHSIPVEEWSEKMFDGTPMLDEIIGNIDAPLSEIERWAPIDNLWRSHFEKLEGYWS